ncbi:hypothetical protein ACFX19_044505 [Malus domestica]
MIKLNTIVQKYIIRIDTIISEELFDEFKKVRSIDEKRYITFREMTAHAMDASKREFLILDQTINMLNSEVEKLLKKVEINQKNSNALDAEMLRMQTKTIANTLKINDHLKQIRSLERKLQEAQSKAAEMEPSQIPYLSASPQGLLDTLKDKKKPSPVPHAAEIQVHTKTPTVEPMSNVVEMEVEKTLIAGLILPIVEHVQIDVNEGKQSVTERKEKTRTLVWNVCAKNDRKQNLDPRFEYVRVHRSCNHKNKFYPINEKEEEENPKGESPLKTKVEATQVQASKVEETKGELPIKACVKSDLKAIINEPEKKSKKKATKQGAWSLSLLC